MEVFKRTAMYSRDMYFSNFKVALVNLMRELNKNKLSQYKKEFKDVKQALKMAATPDQ